MKFHCDRCNTRYSIADERVRGKILKIRCKQCSAVITVREGMQTGASGSMPAMRISGSHPELRTTGAQPALRASSQPAGAARRPGSPLPSGGARRPGGPLPSTDARRRGGSPAALGARRPATSTPAPRPATPPPAPRPPPASLKPQWYVSVNGEQSGPFTLSEARSWIADRHPDEDLHCWNDGFDDWLSVEKVSHFRGLRAQSESRPLPPPPPAPPRQDTTQSDTPAFADALRDHAAQARAQTPGSSRPQPGGGRVPTPAPASAGSPVPAPRRAPSVPAPSRAPSFPPAPAIPAAATPAIPAAERPAIPAAATPAERPAPAPPERPAPTPAKWPAPLPAERRTPAPVAVVPPSFPSPAPSGNGTSHGPSLAASAPESSDDPLDFDISEPSRVVNLATLAAQADLGRAAPRPDPGAGLPGMGPAPAIGRGTGSVRSLGGLQQTGAAAAITDGLAPLPTAELAPERHRVLPFLLAAGLVLAIAAGILFYVVTQDDGDDGRVARRGGGTDVSELGYQHGQPVKRGGDDEVEAEPDAGPVKISTPNRRPRPTGGTGGTRRPSDDSPDAGVGRVNIGDGQPLRPLTPDDVLRVSGKNQIGTKRCYDRALKKDPFLKVKRIKVELTVSPDGSVPTVKLQSLANTDLGRCLAGRIKGWRFPASTKGITSELSLQFEQR